MGRLTPRVCGLLEDEGSPTVVAVELSGDGQGSAGNVIPALASFFIPGLGQLIQGRPVIALVMFAMAGLLWLILLGWVVHLWSIIDAARWKGPGRAQP